MTGARFLSSLNDRLVDAILMAFAIDCAIWATVLAFQSGAI